MFQLEKYRECDELADGGRISTVTNVERRRNDQKIKKKTRYKERNLIIQAAEAKKGKRKRLKGPGSGTLYASATATKPPT